jgi:hypothetical protein
MYDPIIEVCETENNLIGTPQYCGDMLETAPSKSVKYSRGETKFDNAPQQLVEPSFDAFEAAVLGDSAVNKGQQYVCGPLRSGPHLYKPGQYPGKKHFRCSEYVGQRSFHPQDCDEFKDVEAYQAYLQNPLGFRGFGYTTASHTPTVPRARGVFQLSRPVTREEGIALGVVIQEAMLVKLGSDAIKFDESVYRSEQPIYTPLVTSETFHFDGVPIDVDVLLSKAKATTSAAPSGSRQSEISPIAHALTGGGFELPETVTDGDGREEILLGYAGHLRKKGLDQITIERTLLDYNQLHIVPSHPADVVLDRARRYFIVPQLTAANGDGPEPQELTETLPPVPEFELRMLPKTIAAYVKDVAERMSCPVDFPAVAAMVSLGAAIGSRIHCQPYSKGNWMVPAGAWGMVVSPPSAIKSPPLSEMLRPLHQLDKAAASKYAADVVKYDMLKQIHDNAVKASIKSGLLPIGLVPPAEPVLTRYIVNDSTYEKLIEIAAANPSFTSNAVSGNSPWLYPESISSLC